MFIHFPNNWNPDEITEIKDLLADLALSYGYSTPTGPKAGHGNVREILVEIAQGRMLVVRAPSGDTLSGWRDFAERIDEHPDFQSEGDRQLVTTLVWPAILAAEERAGIESIG